MVEEERRGIGGEAMVEPKKREAKRSEARRDGRVKKRWWSGGEEMVVKTR